MSNSVHLSEDLDFAFELDPLDTYVPGESAEEEYMYGFDGDSDDAFCGLPRPSEEQQAIVDAVLGGRNVIVSAVAGSGKTTTSLHVAMAVGGLGLILTYNRQLAHESAERALSAGILAEIRTYHAFAWRYLSRECGKDDGLIRALCSAELKDVPKYSYIILDECQDMTPVLYALATRIICTQECPLVIMGDPRQNIYRFRGADARYMNAAAWPGEFAYMTLSTSYRLSWNVAERVAGLSGVNIVGAHDGEPPAEMNGRSIYMLGFIDDICRVWRENPNGVLVLLPSVRKLGRGAFQWIRNVLVDRRVPIYVSKDDNNVPNELQLRNKVGFITYHQSKGLERDNVLVCMTKHFIKKFGGWQGTCPNEIYVALTRARRRLYIWSDFTIGENLSAERTNFDGAAVTELCRHLRPQILVSLPDYVDVEKLSPAGKMLASANSVSGTYSGREIVEDVSDIVGTMIPGIYAGFDPLCDRVNINRYISRAGRRMPETTTSVQDKCRAFLYHCAERNDQLHRVSQISSFDWISEKTLEAALRRMAVCYGTHEESAGKFEVTYRHTFMGAEIEGRVDIDADRYTWELKYVGELSSENMLQCAIYAWMTGKPGMLFNIRSGELMRITPRENFSEFMRRVICSKYHEDNRGTPEISAVGFDSFEVCAQCAPAVTEENLSRVMQDCPEAFEGCKPTKIKGASAIFRRVSPSFCRVCKCIHDVGQMKIVFCAGGKIIQRCRLNPKNLAVLVRGSE